MDAQKKRKDAISDDLKQMIHSFFRCTDVSRSLADARSAKKCKNGGLISRMVMERSLISAHDPFQSENPGIQISKSQFAKQRPSDVMPSTSNRRRDCLCEYCTNVELKLEASKLFAATHRLPDTTFKDKYDMSQTTLRPKGATGKYQMLGKELSRLALVPFRSNSGHFWRRTSMRQ